MERILPCCRQRGNRPSMERIFKGNDLVTVFPFLFPPVFPRSLDSSFICFRRGTMPTPNYNRETLICMGNLLPVLMENILTRHNNLHIQRYLFQYAVYTFQ